jgi:glutaredoxin
MRHVVLYSRPGCHLCDDARRVVRAVALHHPFSFEEVDIESSDGLLREYGVRIPVVTVDGAEAFEVEVDPERLLALVRM